MHYNAELCSPVMLKPLAGRSLNFWHLNNTGLIKVIMPRFVQSLCSHCEVHVKTLCSITTDKPIKLVIFFFQFTFQFIVFNDGV
jgi:hypothetical protein